MRKAPMYVRRLAKAYKITNAYNLDHQINEFVNLMEASFHDGYLDEEAWFDFIHHAIQDTFGLYRR